MLPFNQCKTYDLYIWLIMYSFIFGNGGNIHLDFWANMLIFHAKRK